MIYEKREIDTEIILITTVIKLGQFSDPSTLFLNDVKGWLSKSLLIRART